MNRGSDAGDLAAEAGPKPSTHNLPRLLLWAGGAVAVAICIAILLLWGIYGPGYLLDLITTYCA